MELMSESWTDGRLDDLNDRIGEGFRQVDERFRQVDERFRQVDERFRQVDERFNRVEGEIKDVRQEVKELRQEMNARFDSMQRSMMQAVVALSVGMLAGFGGLAGLIATQL